MWIGQASGNIAWQSPGLIPGSVYHPLQRVDTFLHGWSDNDPGFDHAGETMNGVSPLPPSAEIVLEVIALDPALYVVDNSSQVLFLPGDATFLGGDNLHIHLTWFIDEDDPAFDEDQCVWEGTFRLVDDSGALNDSAPFTLLFTNSTVRGRGFPPGNAEAAGDFEGDGNVDAWDHRAFESCLFGPAVRPMPDDPNITICEVDCHNAFDFDNDLDTDLRDFAELQVRFGN